MFFEIYQYLCYNIVIGDKYNSFYGGVIMYRYGRITVFTIVSVVVYFSLLQYDSYLPKGDLGYVFLSCVVGAIATTIYDIIVG